MEGWNRAAQLGCREERRRQERPRREDDSGMGLEDYFLPRDPEESWRRMGLRALLLNHGAQVQMAFTELRSASLNGSRDKSSTTHTSLDPTGVRVSPLEIIMRPRLTDSKVSRRCRNTTEECPHSRLRKYGGKTFWFACLNCPARWPREQHEELA